MRQIFTRVEDEDADAMEALAKRNDRSVAAETRLAIRLYLKSNGSGASSPEATPEPSTKGA